MPTRIQIYAQCNTIRVYLYLKEYISCPSYRNSVYLICNIYHHGKRYLGQWMIYSQGDNTHTQYQIVSHVLSRYTWGCVFVHMGQHCTHIKYKLFTHVIYNVYLQIYIRVHSRKSNPSYTKHIVIGKFLMSMMRMVPAVIWYLYIVSCLTKQQVNILCRE